MRALTLAEQAEYRDMNEDDMIEYHKMVVGNYFGLQATLAHHNDLDIARLEVEKIEARHRKYYLYRRAMGLRY